MRRAAQRVSASVANTKTKNMPIATGFGATFSGIGAAAAPIARAAAGASAAHAKSAAGMRRAQRAVDRRSIAASVTNG
ncbi:hypothetical protein BMMON3_11220 [Burkholderia mallei]